MKFYKLKILFFLIGVIFFGSCNNVIKTNKQNIDLSETLNELKDCCWQRPDSTLKILKKINSELEKTTTNLNEKTIAYLYTAIAYDTKGIYDTAMIYFINAEKFAEIIDADSIKMSVFTNFGICFFNQKNTEKAVEYYQKSIDVCKILKDSISIVYNLNNIGNAYMTINKDFEKAIPYFEKAFKISERNNYEHPQTVIGFNLAQIYTEVDNPDKAINLVNDLITKFKMNNVYGDYTLALAYSKKQEYRKAIFELKKILKKEVKLNSREFEVAIMQNIIDIYKQLNILDSALIYTEKQIALRDTLLNIEKQKTILDLNIKYETEKKENQILKLESEKKFILFLIILCAIIIFGLIIIVTIAMVNFKQKKIISTQKIKQLEQEKQLIATQSVYDGENQERKRLAKDLHDGLGGLLSAVKLNLGNMADGAYIERIDVESFGKVIGLLDNAIVELRRVAHNLMPESLSRNGLKTALYDFCKVIPIVKFDYFGEEKRLDNNLEIMIYRVVQELVNNALKHSKASEIFVQLVQNPDSISFSVEDNGIGFNIKEKYSGNGIENIKSRITAFNGILDFKSEIGNGTEIIVSITI